MPTLGVIHMRSFHHNEVCTLAVAFILAIAWFCNSSADNKMTFTKIEYLTSEIMGPPEALLIGSNGSASYESHTNLPERGAGAVGTYATTLNASEIQALDSALTNPPVRDLPDHFGQIAPGERYRLIRVTGELEKVEKRVGMRQPVDPRMQSLLERLDRIVLQVKRHPLRNLQLELTQAQISDGMFVGTITIKNPGTAAATFANPGAMRGVPGGRLSLSGWPDREQSKIHSTDIFKADVPEVEWAGPGANATGEVLELAAGAAVSFRIKVPAPIRSNKEYVVQVLYQNTAAERQGREVMVVELYSPPVKVK